MLIAALNEERGIGPTITELKQVLEDPAFLVVDGRSHDNTVEVAKGMGAEVLIQKGKGKGDAIAQALLHMKTEVEYVVLTDADYTYPAEHIPGMIQILQKQPEIGMVCGNRFASDLCLGKMHNTLYLGNRTIAFIHNMLNGVYLADPLTGLRVIRGRILKGWMPKSKGFDIEVELNHLVERKGFGIIEIPIHYRDRLGEKKLKVRHGLTILRRILHETYPT